MGVVDRSKRSHAFCFVNFCKFDFARSHCAGSAKEITFTQSCLALRVSHVHYEVTVLLCTCAASIIAKVCRDRIMKAEHERFPVYNFAKHKGYATKEHMDAIRDNGPCDLHRVSFDPLRSWIAAGEDAPWKKKTEVCADEETCKG